jgi:hypothetical protein
MSEDREGTYAPSNGSNVNGAPEFPSIYQPLDRRIEIIVKDISRKNVFSFVSNIKLNDEVVSIVMGRSAVEQASKDLLNNRYQHYEGGNHTEHVAQ